MKSDYKLNDTYILRKPFLPFSFFNKIIKSEDSPISTFKTEDLKSQLYLSSTICYNQIDKRLTDKKKNALEQTLFKYLIRYSTRATPLLNISNISLQKYSVNVNSEQSLVTKTRLDLSYYYRIINSEIIQKRKYSELLLFINPTFYTFKQFYKYQNINLLDKENLTYHKVEKNEILNFILIRLRKGLKYKILTAEIIDKFKSKYSDIKFEIDDYIHQLLEIGFVKTELEPSLINVNYATTLINNETLKTFFKKLHFHFEDLAKSLENLDAKKEINVSKLEKLKREISTTDQNLFYLDSFDNGQYTGKKFKEMELINLIQILSFINPKTDNYYIEDFKKEFNFKYSGKTVFLSELFDDEIGLSFDKSNYFYFNYLPISFKNNESDNQIVNDQQYNLLFNEINNKTESLRTLDLECFESTDRLKTIKKESFIVWYEEYRNEKFDFFIKEIRFSNQLSLINRFSQNNQKINDFQKKLNDNKEKEFEISALENIYKGNLFTKNLKSKTNLDFNSGQYSEILYNEIKVKISNNKIILLYKDKEIKPKISSSQTFVKSKIRAYRFLGELQENNKASLRFEWDYRFNELMNLPRVAYGSHILKKARWILKLSQYKSIKEIIKDIKKRSISNLVTINDIDKDLVLNLKNNRCLEILFKELKAKKVIFIEEFLFTDNNGIEIENENYVNEKIAFIKYEAK